MKNPVLYFHGGSGNHGCEAIVRSTCKILQSKPELYSSCPDEDRLYQLEQVTDLKEDKEVRLAPRSISNLWAAVMHKLRRDDYCYTCLSHRGFFKGVDKNRVYLSIGGDNYCYKGRDILGYYNAKIHSLGGKTVLWGCSFEPDDMTDEIAADLARYDLIIAREAISYEALHRVNPNTHLLPDPAFQLDREDLPLPEGFREGHTIGINVSPLAESYGNMVLDNYRELIRWIIEETEEQILLVPHVVKPMNDDRTVLKTLFDEFQDTGRVLMLEDHNCLQLKGYIARCRFFIGARTHATIAAYSTCVPTLVAGYSVKAIGIARELFGTEENYVVPVQSFRNPTDLLDAFRWIFRHETEIRNHLEEFIPDYCKRILKAKELIEQL